MSVTLEIYEADAKTMDRTPLLKWNYDAAVQKAYLIHIINLDTGEVIVNNELHDNDNTRQYNVYKSGGYQLDYATYNASLFVKNQYNYWQNEPIAIGTYNRSSNVVYIDFDRATHPYQEGNAILISGVGSGYDGVFFVSDISTATLSYIHTAGDHSENPAAAHAARGATLNFQIVPVNEKLLMFQYNRQSTGPDIPSTVVDYATGAYRYNNVVTVNTESTHILETGNTVMLSGVTGGDGIEFNGIHTVQKVIDSSQFVFYQAGADSVNGTGGAVMDVGFEDWPTKTDIDITTDLDRVKLYSTANDAESGKYVSEGTFILRSDSAASQTSWGYIVYTLIKPAGTSCSIYARVGDSEDDLDDMDTSSGWTSALDSGDKIDLTGQVLEVKIVMTSNEPNRDQTPILRDMQIAYLIPGQPIGSKTAEWPYFQLSDADDTLIYYQNTENVTYDGTGAVALAVERTVDTFADTGCIVLRHDAKGLNQWEAFRVYGSIPSVTGAALSLQYKHFNKTTQAEDTAWSSASTFTGIASSPYCYTFGSTIENKRFMDIKILFYPSNDKTSTPEINKVEIDWNKVVEGVSQYFYTTYVRLPSNLISTILTPNVDEPDGTEITYGINFNNSTSFPDYISVAPNTYKEFVTGGRNVKIGVQLFSASLLDTLGSIPVLHEFSYEMNTENKDVFYLNQDTV